MTLESFKEFFRAIYELILHIFKMETGWDPDAKTEDDATENN